MKSQVLLVLFFVCFAQECGAVLRTVRFFTPEIYNSSPKPLLMTVKNGIIDQEIHLDIIPPSTIRNSYSFLTWYVEEDAEFPPVLISYQICLYSQDPDQLEITIGFGKENQGNEVRVWSKCEFIKEGIVIVGSSKLNAANYYSYKCPALLFEKDNIITSSQGEPSMHEDFVV